MTQTPSSVQNTSMVKTIELNEDGVLLLDQTALPREVRYTKITTPDEMRHAIETMIVRGAPAIGVAGAYGLVLSARRHLQEYSNTPASFIQALLVDADLLASARPTAINLAWAIDRLKQLIQQSSNIAPAQLAQQIEQEAIAIFEQDLAMCLAIGHHGASLVPKGARILTHCNAGALATAGYGTALGVVRAAFEQDSSIQVYADETRPRLQGARLTTWEMVQEGIPVTLITDNMSAWLMKQGKVDMVIVGADRITANGDTANKIGTYLLALAAKAHGIPFYVAAPSSTIDLSLASGELIPIEERPEEEIYWIHDEMICPAEGVQYYNPSFDVTPAHLIEAIITEKGIFKAPFNQSLQNV
jgi:methylthioribose-1-phosphate isomerase